MENEMSMENSNFCEFEFEKFEEKKPKTLVLADVYKRLGEAGKFLPSQISRVRASSFAQRSSRLYFCGTQLSFRHVVGSDGVIAPNGKLHSANFCKDRLCIMCNWRRAEKIYYTLKRVMSSPLGGQTLQQSYAWIFVTLTIPNIAGEDLRSSLLSMQQSFNRLMKYKALADVVKGFYRTLEITISPVTGEFHPHFHVLIAVDKSYFNFKRSAEDRGYINQALLLSLWRKACRDDSITQVSLKRVRGKTRRNDLSIQDALKEVAKYTLKDADFIVSPHGEYMDKRHGRIIPAVDAETAAEMSERNVYYLACALDHIRLVGFGGVVKQLLKQIKAEDMEEGDLVNIGSENTSESKIPSVYLIRRYEWRINRYSCSCEYILASDDLVEDSLNFRLLSMGVFRPKASPQGLPCLDTI